MSVGRIDLDLGLNYSQFNKQLSGISSTATSKVGGSFKKLAVLVGSAFAVKKLFDFGAASTAVATNLHISEAKLTTIMRQRMGATDDLIRSVKSLISTQELLGVVDADGQTAAAQELATYLEQVDTLKTLIPVVNDLTAQQYGLNASSEQVVGMATMVGKVMDGQVGALSRYGFTFDEAQEKILKYGSEAQRAALLVDIVRDSLGDMNHELAKTPEGQWKQISFTFDAIKESVGNIIIQIRTQLYPYIKVVADYLLKAAQYANALAKAIFGSNNAVAKSSGVASKAQTDLGKAVKKAGKDVKGSLGSFDQLNVIAQATADSMDDMAGADIGAGLGDGLLNGADLTPDIDMSRFQPLLTFLNDVKTVALEVGSYLKDAFGPPLKTALDMLLPPLQGLKETIMNIFSDVSLMGEPLKNWVYNDLTPFFQKSILYMGEIWSGLLDSVNNVMEGLWEAVQPVLEALVTDGLPLLTSFMDGALEVFKSLFDNVKIIFDTLWSEGIQPGLALAGQMIADFLGIIKDKWDQWGGGIIDGVKGVITSLQEIFSLMWDEFLGPVWNKLLDMMSWLWDKHLKGLVEAMADFVGKLVTGAMEIWNEFISPIVKWLIKTLGPTFSNVFSLIGDVIGSIIGVVIDVGAAIFRILGGIIDFIVGIFTGDWEKAWQGVKDIFGGIFDAVVGILKGAINLIIDGINFMIRALNKIHFDIPDWVPVIGGKSFGFNIPEIPKLAKGGLVSGPTLAMVGDNRNASVDPEVVTPLSKLQDMLGASNQAVVEVLMMILDAIERLDLSLEIDGEKLARVLRPLMKNENSRVGRSAVMIGGVPIG